jgi:DNA-binding LytR/AlgR family response regulator
MGEAVNVEGVHSFPWSKQCAVGSFFWLCVLLALEPGNLMRWHGAPPIWSQEVLRLSMASVLFGSCGPAIFWLVRSWPVRSRRMGQSVVWHAATISLLSLVLLTIANILARLFLEGPGIHHLPQEVAANFTLLLAGLAAIDFAVHFIIPKQSSPSYIRHITVKSKHGTFQLPLAQIERLEAQENYVALHTATEAHLVRMTLSSLVEHLDPSLFTRIHRGVVINKASIEKIKAIGSGKLQLTLSSGAEAIASRAYSKALRDLWETHP